MPRWLIQYSDIKITIKADGDGAVSLAKQVIKYMPHKRVTKPRGVRLNLSDADGEWLLHDKHSKVKRKLDKPGDVIYHLSDRIIFHLADSIDTAHCLHAACVSYKGRAIVIPANSGAGKSTLTAWLVANGFDYLTDELFLVHQDGLIEGVARPIQIKTKGLDAISELLTTEAIKGQEKHYFEGKYATAVSISALSKDSAVYQADKVALFVFPKYSKDVEFRFSRLHSARAGMRLMANHVNARSLEGHGFRAMMQIIRDTQCYSLDYGGFDKLPSNYAQRLKKRLLAIPLSEAERRPIRSYVKREGKMTSGQRNAIERDWLRFGIEPNAGLLNLNDLFGRTAPTVLEIGFGNGVSLAKMAEEDPTTNFLGVEVHRPGVGSLLVQVAKRVLTNVRVSNGDAVNVVREQIPEGSLSRIQVFFPDPWHKKKHHKRRLLREPFISELVKKLQPNGVLHIATDWREYAEEILETLSAMNELKNTADGFANKPSYRPKTKYEERGEGLGHQVFDLIFKRLK